MLRIEFEGFRPGPFTELFARLYADVSTDPLPPVLDGYPVELRPYLGTLYRGQPYRLANPVEPPRAVADPGNDTVLVGFSGGKDSTAAALRLQAMGLRPVLWHLKGINPSYPRELAAAAGVARATGFPLKVVQVRHRGRSPYIENPTKNQLILATAVDYGLRTGAGHHAQGGLAVDSASELAFGSGYSDAVECYQTAAAFFASAVQGFHFHARLLKNDTDSFMVVAKHAPHLFPHIQSCMMPVRYRGRLREQNMQKHGVQLLPERCGSCYKCGLEYLHFVLMGLEKPVPGFVEHSVRMLQKGIVTVSGPGADTRPEVVLPQYIDGEVLDWRKLL